MTHFLLLILEKFVILSDSTSQCLYQVSALGHFVQTKNVLIAILSLFQW